MPYHNMPESMWGKMDKCVSDVQGKGKDKQSAIAICYTSLMKGKELGEAMKSFDLKAAPHYRACAKSITDAPNLRGDDARNCWNCNFFQSLPDTMMSENLSDIAAQTMPMGTPVPAYSSGRGICTKYDFEADSEWVCDGWEQLQPPTASKESAISADAELTDAELWTIDRLYLDVQAGKVALPPLEETVTDKAMINYPHGGTPSGGSPGGGSPGRTNGKHEKCYMHLKKLGVGDDEARKVCRVALDSPAQKATAAASESKGLSVFKQADGHYRWVAFTSSSYKDRDGEIISQKALEADTAHMDAKGYGWGDWWHTPIRLASCDFSAMHGRISIESGIFEDDYIGEKMAALAPELAMSRAFYHPANEPDADGVYHHIQTFRRAFLPRGKESNLLTMLYVSKEEKEMLKDKVDELKKKLGGTKEAETKVDALLKVAEETDKAAADAGLAFKETSNASAPIAPPEAPKEEAKPIIEQKGMFVGDMTPEEFDKHQTEVTAKAVAELLTPVLAEVKAQIAAIGEAQATATKEANASVVAQFKAITETQAALDKRLKDLEGEQPRNIFRASHDPSTVITKEQADALKPKPDEKTPKNLSAWIAEPVEQSPIPQ